MFTARISALASILSLIACFLECIGFYLFLDSLGSGIILVIATFLYAFAALVGAALSLPDGLGRGFKLTQ